MVNPSGRLSEPPNMGTSGYRKLFYYCTGDFLNLLIKPIGFELENTNGFQKNLVNLYIIS
jgi:hypothetical protein